MRYAHLRAHEPLDNDRLRQLAPSVFAARPWAGDENHRGMSERYGYIPTIDILTAMRDEGFLPVAARQGKSRIEGKAQFTRHEIRLRHVDTNRALAVGDTTTEVVVTNSHDGTSQYVVDGGLYRLACLNGLMVDAGTIASVKTRHNINAIHGVIDATYEILNEMPRALEQVQQWEQLQLPPPAATAFAEAALSLRYEPGTEPVTPTQLLSARRRADTVDNLWITYNRVQENLIRGGLQSRERDPETRRRRSMRAVNEISADQRLNRALWTLAVSLHQQLAA